MRASRGEIKIDDILTAAGVKFECEYSFPGLVSAAGNPLRFDFAVFDDNGDVDFLIEFNGIQHYQPKSKFGGLAGLRKQEFNDMRKREYCKQHHLTLVVIPYWDENKVDQDQIFSRAYAE